MEVVVRGRVIGTTGEHPFYVYERGWVAAHDLKPGDQFRSHDGQWVAVEATRHTGKFETVYNLRVADFHTYFVGGEYWGFSVWAHNAGAQYVVGASHPDLPKWKPGNPASGILNDKIPLLSGKGGGPAAEVFGSRLASLSEDAAKAAFHVEGQGVAAMLRNQLAEAVLHINIPSGPCGACRSGVPELMGEGMKLWVVFDKGAGFFTRNGWTRML